MIAGARNSSIMSIHDTGTIRRHADGEGYMALHISPSGITCFPRVGTTFLTPSQYQKFCKMSTDNREIFTISELLTNLSIFEPVQTHPASSYCHIWTSDFQDFHNITLRASPRPTGTTSLHLLQRLWSESRWFGNFWGHGRYRERFPR